MNITNAGLRGYNPKGVVIHNDAGSNNANVAFYSGWLPGRNKELGFAHVYIASDGRLQASDFANKAWHCANSYGNANYASWEVCQSEGDLTQFLKNEQAVLDDVAKYMKQWGITPNKDTVKLHRELSATSCPRRSVELHGGTLESCRDYFIKELQKRLAASNNGDTNTNTESKEIEGMFLIFAKDSGKWYVCTGTEIRYIRTERMLGGLLGKFGGNKALPKQVMLQAEIDKEYGKEIK